MGNRVCVKADTVTSESPKMSLTAYVAADNVVKKMRTRYDEVIISHVSTVGIDGVKEFL